ncbi:type III secretion apparatus assembly chaperone SctY [Pseudothauera rhizosphaerae]|uniref:type III secretion apparatus assembly chaperone SctY n=1 Tax=Pseudothauera rhizosphaerae TaxID=2565932 RepID=UPI001454E2F9|nr:tetratricopeptide repeat protein [Pseudothauera rhizosphaerae]
MQHDDRALMRLLAYVYLHNGMPEKAVALFAALRALDADDRDAAKGLAWAHLEADKPQAALKVLDTIVGPGEPGAVVQLLRARAFARLDQNDDAQVAMRAFLALRDAAAKPVEPRRP